MSRNGCFLRSLQKMLTQRTLNFLLLEGRNKKRMVCLKDWEVWKSVIT